MNLEITRSIDRKAWLAALHAKGSADSRLAEQMDKAEKLLKAAARRTNPTQPEKAFP